MNRELQTIIVEVEKAVVGKREVIEKILMALLADGTIARCDYTVRIPMSHGVDSLNVAAASAVAFYQLGLMAQP